MRHDTVLLPAPERASATVETDKPFPLLYTCLAAHGPFLACGSNSGAVHIYSWRDEVNDGVLTLVKHLQVSHSNVTAISISPATGHLAIGTSEGFVAIVRSGLLSFEASFSEASSNKVWLRHRAHESSVTALAWGTTRQGIFSGDVNGRIIFAAISTGSWAKHCLLTFNISEEHSPITGLDTELTENDPTPSGAIVCLAMSSDKATVIHIELPLSTRLKSSSLQRLGSISMHSPRVNVGNPQSIATRPTEGPGGCIWNGRKAFVAWGEGGLWYIRLKLNSTSECPSVPIELPVEQPFPSRVQYLPFRMDFCNQTKEEPDCYIACWSIGQSGLRVVSASTGETCTASEAPVCAWDPKGEPELFKAGIHCVSSTAFRTGSTEKLAVFALHHGGGVSRMLLEKEDLLHVSCSSAEDEQLNVVVADTGSVIPSAIQSTVESHVSPSSTSSHQSCNADDEGDDEGYVASEEEEGLPSAVPLNDDLAGIVEEEPETILVHQSHNEKEEVVNGRRRRRRDAHLNKGLLSIPSEVVNESPSQDISGKRSSSEKGVKGMLSVMSKKVQAMGEALQPGKAGMEALLSSDDEGNEQHPQQAVFGIGRREAIGAGAGAVMLNSSSHGFPPALSVQEHRHIISLHRSLNGDSGSGGGSGPTLVKIKDLPTSAAQDSGTFIPPSHYILKLDATKGLGLVLSIVGSSVRVTGFAEKEGGGAGPAELNGIIAVGDELLALNGKDLFCLKFDEIVAELKGLLGTREGSIELHFAYGRTGGDGHHHGTEINASPHPSSSAALNGADRDSKALALSVPEESDSRLVFGLTPPLSLERKKQELMSVVAMGESLKDSPKTPPTSAIGSSMLNGKIEGSSVAPKFDQRSKNNWKKLTSEKQWRVESSVLAVTFDTPQCVAQNQLASIAHELQNLPTYSTCIDGQYKPTENDLVVEQQHAELSKMNGQDAFQMFKPPPLRQDCLPINEVRGWGGGASMGLFQSRNYIVSTSHSSGDSLPYWYLELLEPSSTEGEKVMPSAFSNMPFLENCCQGYDMVETPLPSANLSLDSLTLFKMLEEAGIYYNNDYASDLSFKVVRENFLVNCDAEAAIDVLLCIVNEIAGEQVKRDVQGMTGLKRDPLGLGVEKLLEGQLKSWPPENLTLAIGTVLLPKCHESLSSAAAIPLLSKGRPLLQAWLQTFAPVSFAQRDSLWDRLRDTPCVEQELKNAELTIRLATAYFLLHVAWPYLTLRLDTNCIANTKLVEFSAFDFDVSFAPIEGKSDMHLPIWSEDEAEDYLDSYGAYLDLDTLAKAAGASEMPRVLSKCLDMSSTTHFGGEDATRNELVEALKWFDQTPKEQADADRGYSCKQAFDVVLEENQISLCLVLRYLLKFFTHNAAQAAQICSQQSPHVRPWAVYNALYTEEVPSWCNGKNVKEMVSYASSKSCGGGGVGNRSRKFWGDVCFHVYLWSLLQGKSCIRHDSKVVHKCIGLAAQLAVTLQGLPGGDPADTFCASVLGTVAGRSSEILMQRIEALTSAWAEGEEHKWWCSLDVAWLLKILQQHALWDTVLTCCSMAAKWMKKHGNGKRKIIQPLLMAGVRTAGNGALASGNMNLLRRVVSCMAFIVSGQRLALTTQMLSGSFLPAMVEFIEVLLLENEYEKAAPDIIREVSDVLGPTLAMKMLTSCPRLLNALPSTTFTSLYDDCQRVIESRSVSLWLGRLIASNGYYFNPTDSIPKAVLGPSLEWAARTEVGAFFDADSTSAGRETAVSVARSALSKGEAHHWGLVVSSGAMCILCGYQLVATGGDVREPAEVFPCGHAGYHVSCAVGNSQELKLFSCLHCRTGK